MSADNSPSTPLPEQSKPFQPGHCARCAGMEPPKEPASKQSDLDEILAKHNGELGVTWEDPDVVTPDTKQAILDWHNKQVEEVLDRLELANDDVDRLVTAIGTERNKLKESKDE